MAIDPERVKRLSVAGAFCLFDKRLSSSGSGSIVLGSAECFDRRHNS